MTMKSSLLPPATVETETVFLWWDYLVYAGLTGLTLAAIAYFLSYWLTLSAWGAYPVLLACLTMTAAVLLINHQARWFLLPWMRRPKPLPPGPGLRVAVVTTFVGGVESLEMLEETTRALVALDYAHDTWVLDEENDERVKALCERLGVLHFSRKAMLHYQTPQGSFQAGTKHGNYNAWLSAIGFDRYDVITAFDPDHVPVPGFLNQVLGYFEDAGVGYVQAAQAYYNQPASFISRGAAEETYAHYSSVQMASYGLGYPIITGCHNSHRMSALKEVGGFAPHDADDLLITLQYRIHGWHGVYVPQILARGLTPVDWHTYLGQQRRWARSVLDLKVRSYPHTGASMSWYTRLMSTLHGLNYLHKGLVIPVSLLLSAFILATGNAAEAFTGEFFPRMAVLLSALQLCEFYRQRFYLDGKREWGVHWRVALLQCAKWPYLLLAFYEALIGRRLPYLVTAKVKIKRKPLATMWPQLGVIALIGGAWLVGIQNDAVNTFGHLWASLIVGSALFLCSTEWWTFPDPYMGMMAATYRTTTLPSRGSIE
jgi:hypothetical protein